MGHGSSRRIHLFYNVIFATMSVGGLPSAPVADEALGVKSSMLGTTDGMAAHTEESKSVSAPSAGVPGPAAYPPLYPRHLVRHTPYRRALVIVLIGFAMGSLFVLSYIDALGRPSAHTITSGIVGSSPRQHSFVDQLEKTLNRGLKLKHYPSQQAAEHAIAHENLYTAMIFTPKAPGAVAVLLSSASGPSVTRLLTVALPTAAGATHLALLTRDLHPLPSADPSGLAVFYITLGATVLGFVTTFQLRANARPLPLPPWLAFTGGLAILGSLVLVLLVTKVLHALDPPLLEAWAVLALQMITASAVAALMSVIVGKWAIIPTWLLFVVLGNTSSGGAVAPALLPEPFRFLSRALPTGATVSFLRTSAYFPSASRLEPLLVLVTWAVLAVAGLLLASRLLHRGPGDESPRP